MELGTGKCEDGRVLCGSNDTAVPTNLGEPSGAGEMPVEVGAEAVEEGSVGAGGDHM